MKKISTSATAKRPYVFALAVTAGVAGYVFFFFVPGQRATAELRRELVSQKDYVLQSGEFSLKITELEKELERTKKFTHAWHAASPNDERLAHVFVKITEHANAANADIARFEPQPAEPLAYVRRVPLELAIEGNFLGIFEFIKRLETLDSELWIERMQFEPVPATAGRLRCELQLALFAGATEISD
jgi:Tfp pilus assembly protein PilO